MVPSLFCWFGDSVWFGIHIYTTLCFVFNVQSEGLLNEMMCDPTRDKLSKELQRCYTLRRHGGFKKKQHRNRDCSPTTFKRRLISKPNNSTTFRKLFSSFAWPNTQPTDTDWLVPLFPIEHCNSVSTRCHIIILSHQQQFAGWKAESLPVNCKMQQPLHLQDREDVIFWFWDVSVAAHIRMFPCLL